MLNNNFGTEFRLKFAPHDGQSIETNRDKQKLHLANLQIITFATALPQKNRKKMPARQRPTIDQSGADDLPEAENLSDILVNKSTLSHVSGLGTNTEYLHKATPHP